jgi:Ca2+-transporting ATPase
MPPQAVIDALAVDPGQKGSAAPRRADVSTITVSTRAERPPTGSLTLLGRQFTSLPVGLLLGASAVSVLTGGVLDAVVTLVVVGINAAIGYGTESGSERIIRSMTQRQALAVPALREGSELLIDQEQLVPGDVLILRPNTVVAADARLIETDGLLTNEALLTGESEPVEKGPADACLIGEALSQRRNIVYQGSFVVNGTAAAVVVATGTKTETGRIEAAAQEVSTPRTPLERDLDDLGAKLAVLSLAACGALSWAISGADVDKHVQVRSLWPSQPSRAAHNRHPTLALGLRDLRRKGVIVRRLEAVEGLARR